MSIGKWDLTKNLFPAVDFELNSWRLRERRAELGFLSSRFRRVSAVVIDRCCIGVCGTDSFFTSDTVFLSCGVVGKAYADDWFSL